MAQNKVRWFFWTGVIVLVVIPWSIGMARMLRIGRTQPAATMSPHQLPIRTEAAAATAQAFVAEYLSYETAAPQYLAERTRRLRAYWTLDEHAGMVPSIDSLGQIVLQTWVRDYENVSSDGTRGTVIVQAWVGTRTVPIRNLFVAVPLATDGNGRWVVTGYPRFVAAPGLAQVTPEASDLSQTLPDPDGSIKAMVMGFMKAYVTGAPAEISVYMAAGSTAPKGLAGTMKAQLREVNEVRLIQTGNGTARADVTATLTDEDPDAAFKQTFRIVLSQAGGRWSVVRFD